MEDDNYGKYKNNVSKGIADVFLADKTGDFQTAEEVRNALKKAIGTCALLNCPYTELNSIITKYGDILGIDKPKHIPATTVKELQECVSDINPSKSKTNCGSCGSAILYNISHIGEGKAVSLSEVPMHMRTSPNSKGYDPEKLLDCFENSGKWESIWGLNKKEIHKKIESKILSYGEGSKGLFYTDSLDGGAGHYFTWTVFNGKMNILEGQPIKSGIIRNTTQDIYDNVFKHFDPSANIGIVRLDVNGIVNIKPGREKDLFELANKT